MLLLVAVGVTVLSPSTSMVFYNALVVPSIVPSTRLGRISAWGPGLSYIGGVGVSAGWGCSFRRRPTGTCASTIVLTTLERTCGMGRPVVAIWLHGLLPAALFICDPGQRGRGCRMRAGVETGLVEIRNTLRNLPSVFPSSGATLARDCCLPMDLNTLLPSGRVCGGNLRHARGQVHHVTV